MKTRFNTFDIICTVTELQKYVGMRVNNIYDIDNKTYLIRLQRNEEKLVLLLESGIRLHSTNFEWPKNMMPSGFCMKLRKHLKNKRLESLRQLGIDRIIDLQFGTGDAAYHIILELYDRGNIILTDHEFVILNVLRPHTEGDKVKFAVKEKYPENRARQCDDVSKENLIKILESAKPGDQLRKVLVSNLEYGPAVIDHVLASKGIDKSAKIGKSFNITNDIDKLLEAITNAEDIFAKARKEHSKGYIIQKKEDRPVSSINKETEYYSNQEFHPMLFCQHSSMPYKEFETFNTAVDEFFSSMESQKLELKVVHQEREAMKKLENVRKDHDTRLEALEKTQEIDKQKAELIMRNQELVDKAMLSIQALLANQTSWEDIKEIVNDATLKGDPIAKHIKELKLEINHISLYLTDPYAGSVNNSNESENEEDNNDTIPPMVVDVDLALTTFANARRYYDKKRTAAKKQQKTIESQTKALKSAERKTKLALKEVHVVTNIQKARKVYWFEKFYWFVSSENYLVIAGRDQQQNELIVKRYLKATDVYVHADIHGASSVVIKNPTGQPIPPKTLNEAGTMAICYSVAWEAKVITNAYWVWGDQVSKTAPTGEYLPTGSFMVRGKKNFLPPSNLILGLGFLFKLEESFIPRHKGERKVLSQLEEEVLEEREKNIEEVEVEIHDESEEDEVKDKPETEENEEQEKSKDASNLSDDEGDAKFPDTHIKIYHTEGTKIKVVTEPNLDRHGSDNENENVIYLGDNKPVILKPTNKRTKSKSESKDHLKNTEEKEPPKQQSKRGQKGKLKKIKEKYKDQDEEERKLRMEILQSSGSGKETKKSKKSKDAHAKEEKRQASRVPREKPQNAENMNDDEPVVQADVDMIDGLTGIPLPDDELLFAVPVIAPYNTMSNYRFKVKLTPGTGKRGKAAKTAVAMFIKDRTITPREKDLLKAVKDEQLARNIPGKVKISAPKMQNLKK